MEYQYLVSPLAPVRRPAKAGDAEFLACIAAATGCVTDRSALAIDLVVTGCEHRFVFESAAEFEAALAAVRRAGVRVAGHWAVVGSVWSTVLACLAAILAFWLLRRLFP